MCNENKDELGNAKELAEKFEALVKINHGWKKDYEKLQMRYEMLNVENRRVEDEENKLKVRIRELEKQQTLLELEIAKLVYAQQSSNGGQLGGQSPSEEQCELLKSQMIAYKEDYFERERVDRENLHEVKEKFKHQLEDAEDIIKQLTAELEALEEAGGDIAEFITDAL